MRRYLQVSSLVLLLLLAGAFGLGAATARGSVVLHANWRLVTSEPGAQYATLSAVADDRYVAISEAAPGAPTELTLLDEQTGEPRSLLPPDCPDPGSAMFGGSWLMLQCTYSSGWNFDLYNLESAQWSTLHSSQELLQPLGLGRYWIKFIKATPPGCGTPTSPNKCEYSINLWNLLTGEVKPDPATAGSTTFDDLDSPSGAVPVCPPLRYPLGGLTFVQGGFALAASAYPFLTISPSGPYYYTLERCGSPLKLGVATYSQTGPDIRINSRAVLWHGADSPETPSGQFGRSLQGRFLPSLLEFKIPWPPGGEGALAALTKRTIYIENLTATGTNQLWAADIPAEPPTVSALHISPRTFTLTGRLVKGRCVQLTRANRRKHSCTRSITLRLSFKLNIPARVRFAIKRPASGRRVKGRCEAPTRRNGGNRKCTRLLTLRGFLAPGNAGENSLILHRRIARHQLAPGTYRLTATGTLEGRTGETRSITFHIAA